MSLSINNIKKFNGIYNGITTNTNNNVDTRWRDLRLVFDVLSNGYGQINGIGYSIFNRKKIPFLIFGTFDSNLKNLKINKVHIGNGFYNTIMYNISFDLETNKILLKSDNAVGEIQLDDNIFNNEKYYKIKNNDNKKFFGCI